MDAPLSDSTSSQLRCPETGHPLRFVEKANLEPFPGEFPEGAYVTEDGSRAYPIREGLPFLVASEAVFASR